MKPKSETAGRPVPMTRWKYCTAKFFEFCRRTDLHGYKYIAMEELSVTERSVWGVVVIISFICAIYAVITAYRWYARNPVLTVIETNQGVTWDVPFPAITICDLNMVSRRAARNFADNLSLPENITADFVFKTLKFAPLLHSSNIASQNQKRDLSKLQDVLDFNHITLETLFREISPAADCISLLDRCLWKNTIYRCNQIFQHIFVGVSLCCTFNYYAVDDQLNELMIIRYPTPRRVASCGYQTALTVVLKTDPSDYYSTMVASYGSLVFVDNVYHVPDMDSPVRMVNPHTEVMIAVSPETTYTISGIKSFSPEERQCYYSDEIKIENFHQYSFHNCMALRKVQILISVCECIPFYFPQNKDRHRTCDFHDIDCLENILNASLMNETGVETDQKYNNSRSENLIKCLPECEHFDYPLEVAVGQLSTYGALTGTLIFKDIDLDNKSVVNVFLKDMVATRYSRDVYLNWQNLLASFGGLLSLLLGFTLISGFDFVLFFLIQVIYDSITKIFSSDDGYLQSGLQRKGYFINVEEHKKEDWVKKSRQNKAYKDLKRKQAELFYPKFRY